MKKFILVSTLLITSILTFSNPKPRDRFWIISHTEFSKRIIVGKDIVIRRYIVIPELDKNYKDIFETHDEKAILSKFSYALKKNKTKVINKYAASCDKSLDINHLVLGLYYMSMADFSSALNALEKFNNKDLMFLKLLLIADCKYELLPDKKNYKSILGVYQPALDIAIDEQSKTIIKNRVKYIKYQ